MARIPIISTRRPNRMANLDPLIISFCKVGFDSIFLGFRLVKSYSDKFKINHWVRIIIRVIFFKKQIKVRNFYHKSALT